jgi:hypothetical protein
MDPAIYVHVNEQQSCGKSPFCNFFIKSAPLPPSPFSLAAAAAASGERFLSCWHRERNLKTKAEKCIIKLKEKKQSCIFLGNSLCSQHAPFGISSQDIAENAARSILSFSNCVHKRISSLHGDEDGATCLHCTYTPTPTAASRLQQQTAKKHSAQPPRTTQKNQHSRMLFSNAPRSPSRSARAYAEC